MNLADALQLFAGGPGSGCNPAVGKCGRTATGEELSDKAKRALAAYVPATKWKQDLGDKMQQQVAKVLGGMMTPNNAAFDVKVPNKPVAVEVKTIIQSKYDRVYIRKECAERKVREARREKLKPYVVAVDFRDSKNPVYYYQRGVKNWALRDMIRVNNPRDLRGILG